MINEIFNIVNKIQFGVDGDVVDRLHHKYTVFLLIFLSLFLTAEAIVGERIKCFSQVVYPKGWHTYISRLCWVKNTYQVDFGVSPQEAKEDGFHEIVYYQWAAIILALAAVMFYLPCKLWHFFAERAGLNIDNMIKTCSNFAVILDDGKRMGVFTNLALFLDRFFDAQALNSKKQRGCLSRLCSCFSRSSGNYLGFGYLLTKFAYLLNVTLQFTFMTMFLGRSTQFENFGFSVTKFITEGMVWEDSSRFPRVTLCDINTRQLGDVKKPETVQCVLPQNIYMEKAFIIVWWWYVMLMFITVFNIIEWIIRIYGNNENKTFVKRYLQAIDKFPLTREEIKNRPGLRSKLGYFVHDYLMQDGVFVLKLVSKNVSSLMMSQIVGQIWQHFIDNFEEEMRQRGIMETPIGDGDEAALVPSDEGNASGSESDPDGPYKSPYAEHGTLEGDRKPSAPPERLYPNM